MYAMFVRVPSRYNFDLVEVLSDVMDTQLSVGSISDSLPGDIPVDVGVKAKSLALVDSLKTWLDGVQDPDLDVELLVGNSIVSLRAHSAAEAKAAVEKASGNHA